MIKKIKAAISFYHKKLGLRDIEDYGIEINALGNGENHLIYLATIDDRKFVFRISFHKELEASLKNEFEILKKIPRGLGPKPFVFDDSKKIIPSPFMIQSFVPGKKTKTWTKDLLIIHAKQLALLHSENIKEKKENLYEVFIRRADFTRNNQSGVIEDDRPIEEIFIKLGCLFSENKQIFEKQRHSYLVHADLHDDNILVEKNHLHYVDWEEAKYGDNALDVGTLLWFIELDKENYKLYLDAYQSRLKDEDLEKRMILWLLYKDFSLLLHKKWQSLDSRNRAINLNEDYDKTIKEIIHRIRKRIKYFSRL